MNRVPDAPIPGSPPALHAPTKILDHLEQVIVGQRAKLAMVMACLFAGGHVLLEDRPGVGKTVLARAIGATLGLEVSRVQGTPDLLPTDITGVHIFNPKTGDWSFRAGPILAPLILVDELNRATPKAQSALLEAMAEGQVTIDGTTMMLPENAMVIATQNPKGDVGTHPLGNAQLDRFAISLALGLPGRDAERQVLLGNAGTSRLGAMATVVSPDEQISLRRQIASLPVSPVVMDYVLDVVEAFRSIEGVWLSVRVSQMLLQLARGHAVFQGRGYVAPEDVQAMVEPVFTHRLSSSFDPSAIGGVLATVPVPVASGNHDDPR